ncbi:hypothetical protein TNCV_4539531 [Trichonephila clavipes]|nr:hypothetical protein TNCV_4539531 [Trichonephila clavipes]
MPETQRGPTLKTKVTHKARAGQPPAQFAVIDNVQTPKNNTNEQKKIKVLTVRRQAAVRSRNQGKGNVPHKKPEETVVLPQ